jgi:hypothetical protein
MTNAIIYHGPVGQAFHGSQIDKNIVTNIFGRGSGTVLRRQHLSAESRNLLRATWVPPDNHDGLLARLRENRILVLLGQVGSGSPTAAVALLDTVVGLAGTIRTIQVDEEVTLEVTTPERGEGLLLSLSDDDGSLWSDTAKSLTSYREQLEDNDAFLIVIAPLGFTPPPDIPYPSTYQVWIEPADPLRILRAHLHAHDVPFGADAWVSQREIADLVIGKEPRQVVRLVDIINRTTARMDTGTAIDNLVPDVRKAFADWSEFLSSWFNPTKTQPAPSPLQGPDDTRLLIAAAVLEGASPLAILRASDQLEPADGFPGALKDLQLGRGLSHSLIRIGARVEASQVQFTRVNFAESVLQYVWNELPRLRQSLQEWVIALPTYKDISPLPAAVLGKLPALLVAFAKQKNDISVLSLVVHQWTRDQTSRELMEETLYQAAVDAHIGGRTRRLLYDWSQRPGNTRRGQAVAAVCGRLGSVYPDIALTRLRHLASWSSADVLEYVLDAVRSIARTEPQRALRATVRWSCDPNPVRQRSGDKAFLAIAGLLPNPAVDYSPGNDRNTLWTLLGDDLGEGWCNVLNRTELDRELAPDVVGRWLDFSLEQPELRQQVIRTLARGTRLTIADTPSYDGLNRNAGAVLAKFAYGWAQQNRLADGESPAHATVRDLVMDEVFAGEPRYRPRTAGESTQPGEALT